MPDQADNLRRLLRHMEERGWRPEEVAGRPPRVRRARTVAITGGKGGVGKTSLAVNLGLALAASGRKTLLVDVDLGLASADLLLGLAPERSLAEVVLDDLPVRQALVRLPAGLDFLPGVAGVAQMADLAPVARQKLLAALAGLEDDYDFILLDTAAGAGESVRAFLRGADGVLAVATPEPAAITDAYALVKLLAAEGQSGVGLAVNMARSEREAQRVGERFAAVARQYLGAEIELLGSVPFDWQMAAAARQRRALLVAAPFAPASIAIRKLAAGLCRWAAPAGAAADRDAARGGVIALLRQAVGL